MNDHIDFDSVEDVRQAILRALNSEGAEQLQKIAWTILDLAWRSPKLFSACLDLLIDAVFWPECLEHEGSESLLRVLQMHWKRLNKTQRGRLLRGIEANYDAFTDWMSWFTISELLGECYANRAALIVLDKLSRTAYDAARAFVPHGYEHLVSDSGDEGVARKAYAKLLGLRRDPSGDVRQEAEMSLARLRGVDDAFAADPLHAELRWREPWASFQVGETVEGLVVGYEQDGLIVEVRGVREWVAIWELTGLDLSAQRSQVEDQLRARVGECLRLKVLEVDRWRGHVKLSERAAREDEHVH